jgi:hypothetical protein
LVIYTLNAQLRERFEKKLRQNAFVQQPDVHLDRPVEVVIPGPREKPKVPDRVRGDGFVLKGPDANQQPCNQKENAKDSPDHEAHYEQQLQRHYDDPETR